MACKNDDESGLWELFVESEVLRGVLGFVAGRTSYLKG